MGTFGNTFGGQGSLLKPLEPETTAYITGLTTPLSKPVIAVIDTYVKELKTATGGTLAQAFDFLFLLNAPTKETTLKNTARDAFHLIDDHLPEYTPNYGYQGIDNKYLDPNYRPSTNKIVVSQNSSSMGFFSTHEASAGKTDIGIINAPYFLFQIRYTGDIARLQLSNAISSGKTNSTSKGFFIASRMNAPQYNIYRDGINIGTETITSEALSNNKLLILAGSLNNAPFSFSNKECAVAFVGRGFTPTEITEINTATQKYVVNMILAKDFDYKFTTRYIATQKDNKILEFDDAGTLFYSIDGGVSYISKVTSPTISIITFAHIFDNGNVIFADRNKVYLSTNNLTTYAETTVKGIDGNTFVPDAGSTNDFRTIGCSDSIHIGGVEVLAWGVYTENSSANVWYTKDCGVTIKSLWKSGVTLCPSTFLTVAHIHSVVYNADTNKWYIFTGDLAASTAWIEGDINIATDVATWNIIGSGVLNYKTLSMFFMDGYAYWSADGYDAPSNGIWRCLYADMGTPANWEHIYTTSVVMLSFYRNGNGCIASLYNSRDILVSDDMINFRYIRVVGGPNLDQAWNAYYGWKPKNSNGYFAADIWSSTESRSNYTSGASLLLKF